MCKESAHFHSPQHCNDYAVFKPLVFSHKRFFAIKARQARYKFSTNKPFLSSETIASIVDTSILSKTSLKRLHRRSIAKSKSFFVQSDLLEDFLDKTDGVIARSVLFTGHSDRNFDYIPAIPEAIKLWFAQNSSISDSNRFYTLPIGLENISLGRSGLRKFYRADASGCRIENQILVPPMSATNPVRLESILYCKTSKYFDVKTELVPERQYFDLARGFRFVLCLEGNGYDNHRLWETLYQGNFPVVIRTKWSQSLSYLNLPILYVDSLSEVSESLLASFLVKNSNYNPRKLPQLWSPFWKKIAKHDYRVLDIFLKSKP